MEQCSRRCPLHAGECYPQGTVLAPDYFDLAQCTYGIEILITRIFHHDVLLADNVYHAVI